MTHASGASQARLRTLVNDVRKDLAVSNVQVKLVRGASRKVVGANGHVALWAPHIKLLAAPPCGKLVARIYVKQAPKSDA